MPNSSNNNPEIVAQRLKMGNHLRSVGSYERAIEQYRAALEIDIDCALAHANLAFVLLDAGRVEEAMVEAENALRLEPFNHNFLYVKGKVFSHMEDWESAQELYEKAISIFPNRAAYFASLSFVLQEQGWYFEAVEAAEHALEITPESEFALRCAGYALTRMGRYDEARQFFEKALKLYPDKYQSHAGLAYFYERVHDDERSLYHAKETLRLNPQTDAVKIVSVQPIPTTQSKTGRPKHVLDEDIGVLATRFWSRLSVAQRVMTGALLLVCIGAMGMAFMSLSRENMALGSSLKFPFALAVYAVWRGLSKK